MGPDGPVDSEVAPVAITDEARPATVTLMAPGWRPPDRYITQSYAICFTGDGGIVLGAVRPGRWNLPGGTIEAGETPEDALVREVTEEVCATVTEFAFLAVQHVWDPENPGGRVSYYQSRWWARVRLDDWAPCHEVVERTVVAPDRFLSTLYWREKTVAARLLELAMRKEESSWPA